MAVRSKITIFNAALTKTGNSQVTEADGSFIWQALEANYDEIVRAAFETGEFTFGKVRSTLTSRAVGRFGYDDAYTMPNDVIHVEDVYLDEIRASDLSESWEVDVESNELMINAQGRVVEVKYLKVGMEHRWTAKFALGIQRKCEAVIQSALEESSEAADADADADFKLLTAGIKSAKNRSKVKVRRGGRLIAAHSGRRRR